MRVQYIDAIDVHDADDDLWVSAATNLTNSIPVSKAHMQRDIIKSIGAGVTGYV